MEGIKGRTEEIVDSKTYAVDSTVYLCRKYNSFVRLPAFIGGAGLVGVSIVDYFRGNFDFGNKACLEYGLALLSLASSMYIKDTDPKLLDKEPFWKTAYDWVREKVNSLVPEPIPQPNLLSVDLS